METAATREDDVEFPQRVDVVGDRAARGDVATVPRGDREVGTE